MSHQATSWVLERSEAEGKEFIVLFVIANHCGPDGTGAWPSERTIAAEARMSERAARYCIRDLEISGELVVKRHKYIEPKEGWKGRNDYSIPGVVRDCFYRLRESKSEASFASGSEKDSGKPRGNELPINNPLELTTEQEKETPFSLWKNREAKEQQKREHKKAIKRGKPVRVKREVVARESEVKQSVGRRNLAEALRKLQGVP